MSGVKFLIAKIICHNNMVNVLIMIIDRPSDSHVATGIHDRLQVVRMQIE